MTSTEQTVLELGERAAVGLRAENYGLLIQRTAAICKRMPWCGWALEYENGVPVRMRRCEWAATQ